VGREALCVVSAVCPSCPRSPTGCRLQPVPRHQFCWPMLDRQTILNPQKPALSHIRLPALRLGPSFPATTSIGSA